MENSMLRTTTLWGAVLFGVAEMMISLVWAANTAASAMGILPASSPAMMNFGGGLYLAVAVLSPFAGIGFTICLILHLFAVQRDFNNFIRQFEYARHGLIQSAVDRSVGPPV